MTNQQPSATNQAGDPAAGYLADLQSSDEAVRARAATALQKLGHPQALDACLKTLNDAPDELHLDITPAVRCLRAIGRPALPPLLDRLTSDDRMARARAEQAVSWITKLYFGFDGQSWSGDGQDRWSAWWVEIGYDSSAPDAERRAAVQRMRDWLAKQ